MTYTELFFRLYTASTLITVSTHFILKCGFNNNFFDQFIYLGSKENIYKYVLTHVVAYIVTGFIFGNEKLLWTFLKTTFVEILLVVMKNCNIYKIDKTILASILEEVNMEDTKEGKKDILNKLVIPINKSGIASARNEKIKIIINNFKNTYGIKLKDYIKDPRLSKNDRPIIIKSWN